MFLAQKLTMVLPPHKPNSQPSDLRFRYHKSDELSSKSLVFPMVFLGTTESPVDPFPKPRKRLVILLRHRHWRLPVRAAQI